MMIDFLLKKEFFFFLHDAMLEKISASYFEIFNIYAIFGINMKLFVIRLHG